MDAIRNLIDIRDSCYKDQELWTRLDGVCFDFGWNHLDDDIIEAFDDTWDWATYTEFPTAERAFWWSVKKLGEWVRQIETLVGIMGMPHDLRRDVLQDLNLFMYQIWEASDTAMYGDDAETAANAMVGIRKVLERAAVSLDPYSEAWPPVESLVDSMHMETERIGALANAWLVRWRERRQQRADQNVRVNAPLRILLLMHRRLERSLMRRRRVFDCPWSRSVRARRMRQHRRLHSVSNLI